MVTTEGTDDKAKMNITTRKKTTTSKLDHKPQPTDGMINAHGEGTIILSGAISYTMRVDYMRKYARKEEHEKCRVRKLRKDQREYVAETER